MSSWVCIVAALAITVWLRVRGLHLTEGEQLVAFWPWWLTALVLLVLGIVLTIRDEKGRGE